ncbi:hypothetical protein AAE478_001314 [Parahypoxylon ruwenzoriense]
MTASTVSKTRIGSLETDPDKHDIDRARELLSLPDATAQDFLDSIRRLHGNGPMPLSTNYDDLVEKHCGLSSVDRSDSNGMI